MKILTSKEMAAMDRRATEQYGVPSLTLMENAGRCVADAAASMLGGPAGRRVALFCGKGNNGGDGLVAARRLHETGARVLVFLLASFQDLRGDAKINLDMATRAGIRVKAVTSETDLADVIGETAGSDLVVDALLGTGFTPPVRSLYEKVIGVVNEAGLPVLAVDIPSGLSSDSGKIAGAAVRADLTVTFGLPKPGQFLYPASALCGRLLLADIGFPSALVDRVQASHFLVTPAYAAARLSSREPDSHKGTWGHALVLAGSRGFAGASVLAARGALRAGAGLVTVATPESQAPLVQASLPEAMTVPLPETKGGAAGERALEIILENLPGKRVLAAGPGLSRDPGTFRLVRSLLPRIPVPMVVDADGLNALAGSLSLLLESKAEVIITPHPGELGRLLGISAAEVQESRIEHARSFSKKYGVIVVLKGAHTVVSAPTGAVHVNTTGNAGMAAGGMGDVLTGVIASLVAQGHPPLEAAVLGVFLHGLAGDIAAAGVGPRGYLAGEVADDVPAALRDTLNWKDDEKDPGGALRVLLPRGDARPGPPPRG